MSRSYLVSPMTTIPGNELHMLSIAATMVFKITSEMPEFHRNVILAGDSRYWVLSESQDLSIFLSKRISNIKDH